MTKMRDRMERFAVLPFSLGCVSQASVAVIEERPRRSRSLKSPSSAGYEEEDEDSLSSGSTKLHSSRFLTLPKPNLSTGVNRLVKGFKSLSQLFMYEDEMEELGMEIGLPTDVKHVTHIGWDGNGTTTTRSSSAARNTTNLSSLMNSNLDYNNPLMGLSWHDLFSPTSDFLPSLTHHHHQPILPTHTSSSSRSGSGAGAGAVAVAITSSGSRYSKPPTPETDQIPDMFPSSSSSSSS